jgi:Phage integrase family
VRGASRVARSWRCAARALARLPRSRRRRSTPGQRCAPPCRRARRASSARQPSRGATPVRANLLRHAHAVELAREGVPLNVIQRQLGHANLGTTSGLPSGHRHRGDHRRRPHKTRTDDVRHRRPTPLKEHNTSNSGRSATNAPPVSRPQLQGADGSRRQPQPTQTPPIHSQLVQSGSQRRLGGDDSFHAIAKAGAQRLAGWRLVRYLPVWASCSGVC